MNKENFWELFKKTGKIEYYLKYKNYKEETDDRNDKKNRRNYS